VSRFVSSSGTLLVRNVFAVWSVLAPVNRNFRSLSALTRICLHVFLYRHLCIIAAQTPHSCCTISPTKSHSKTFGDGSKVSPDRPAAPFTQKIPSQLINSLLTVRRTQEELSRRLDNIYRGVQGGPFPPSTGFLRSCAPLPPSVVPTTSATAATSTSASAFGVLLHPPSLYLFHVDQICPSDDVRSSRQTFSYRFPFE
jgi:hypothetical protein